jgi:aminoglycoside phosphotransferase family enzyme/predicted kinase
MDPLIAALLHPRAYPHPTGPINVRETHISWVLLSGPFAYKIKKPVSLGFVDFSRADQRRHFCEEELRLNKRLAPEIYLDLVDIHGPAEEASLLGSGPVIEVAVRMHQFAEENLLSRALGTDRVSGKQLERFAERLALFHGDGEVASPEGPFGTPQAVRAPALANLEVLRRIDPEEPTLANLQEWTLAEGSRLEGSFAQRLAQGRVREGHGDLHLDNLVVHQGQVLGFDCLEFNPSLRWIDVLSDVAFLAMDLQQRGETVLAGRVLNRWLITCGDYGALNLWAWYRTYRALVRAKVLALRMGQLSAGDAQQRATLNGQLWGYIHQAQGSRSDSGPGALILTHGVSGSGKSQLALQLCERHGWIHLRSDVERRRLFGFWGTALHPPRDGDCYSPAVTRELYDRLLPQAAEQILKAGITVVVDATFLKRAQRKTFLSLAERLRAPAVILDCPVSLEVAKDRIARRSLQRTDPSEADASVLIAQWSLREPLDQEEQELMVEGSNLNRVEEALQQRLQGCFRTTPPPPPRPC